MPDVTVLTGANDSGKSLALRAIEILCSNVAMKEHEANRDRVDDFEGSWEHDKQYVCEAEFKATELSAKMPGIPNGVKSESTLFVTRETNKTQGMIRKIQNEKQAFDPRSGFNHYPKLLVLPLADEIRQEIDLNQLNSSEQYLIKLGFGNGFTIGKHKASNPTDRSFKVREAEKKLNERMSHFFPETLPFHFMLQELAGDPSMLGVGLVDGKGGFTPLGQRGTGVKRLLNVMGALLRISPKDDHTILLYDEPETSLHADAQHALRKTLEGLGSQPNIQVVYTTHSPAMINNFRPESIRVVKRVEIDGKAQSTIVNEAFDQNFSSIRTSLGVCPSDSLLFASITIVAEGKSEVLGIPAILTKLADTGKIQQDGLNSLLSQCHVLDGEGSSFERMCDLAISQNAKPIVFLDGDKKNEKRQFQKKHPKVPIIELSQGQEFEDLVPKASYLKAISELLLDNGDGIDVDSYEKWVSDTKPKDETMFSKRINRFLFDSQKSFQPPKHKAILRAIELSNIEEITFNPIIELLQKMKEVANT